MQVSFRSIVLSALSAASMLVHSHVLAQMKEQLVGTWTMTSADGIRADGTRFSTFGNDPKGTMIFTREGQFALVQMRGDLPRIAANSREQGTPEENKALVAGSIAYFGTWTANDADKTITLKLEGSTFPNLLAQSEQKRLVTTLTADELKFTNPRTPSGLILEVAWKKAR